MPTTSQGNVDRERGSAIVVALLLTLLLFVLGAALLAVSETESAIAANDQWQEGAFQAAEAAVQVAMDQLSVTTLDQTVSTTVIGDQYTYRSGGRDDTSPQPATFVGSTAAAGFAIGSGTGYNESGYSFDIYQVNGTGFGPRNTEREVEIQVELGPVDR